jgi:hypothetical protein
MINAVMLSVLLSNVVAPGRGKEEGQGWGWNPRGADFEIFFRRYLQSNKNVFVREFHLENQNECIPQLQAQVGEGSNDRGRHDSQCEGIYLNDTRHYFNNATLSITTLSIMALSILTLGMLIKCNTQPNDIKNYDTRHNNTTEYNNMPSVISEEGRF